MKARYRHVLVPLQADAVADEVLSAHERAELEPLLDDLIASAVEFRAMVRG